MSKSDKENHSNLSREEKLRMENEIEKLKLSAFHDAEFFTKSGLPPEVENEWLKYIAHFEKKWEDVERITLTKKLGDPEFPAVETLSEQEIAERLDEVQQLMAEHGVFLDTITEVPAVEIYRFITEELFQEEIDHVDIEGMQTVFIYEEFYPSDELDIEQALTDFILQLFSKEFHDHLHMNVAETCKTTAGEPLSAKDAVEKAIAFTELYDQLELGIINNFKFNIDKEMGKASASFEVSYTATTGREVKPFEGEATASMAQSKLGYWNIVTLHMPGFSF